MNTTRFNFTDEEKQILPLLAAGYTLGQIAEKLNKSKYKVKKIINNIVAITNTKNKHTAIYLLAKLNYV